MCENCGQDPNAPDTTDRDIDDVHANDLGEYDAKYTAVWEALCARDMHGTHRTFAPDSHFVGLFLDELAARGYRVEPILAPALDVLLRPPEE